MKRVLLIVILIFTFLFMTITPSYAQVLKGGKYIFDIGGETGSAQKQAVDPNSIVKVDHESKTISGPGFTAKLSYEDDLKNLPLVITTSSDTVNFKEVKPGEAVIRSLSLEIIPGSAISYQVIGDQDENLKSEKHEISSTSCDSGNCNQILSDTWILPLVYGFGFRCDDLTGNICSPKMPKEHYKRHANYNLNEQPARILSSSVDNPGSAILTYKINIPGNQPQGGYQNILEYIIVPNI